MFKVEKPNVAFNRLLNDLIPHAEKIVPKRPGDITKGIIIKNDPEFFKLFLLEEGSANLCRLEDNLIISTVFSPHVIGLSFYPGAGVYYSIELGAHSCLYQISRTRAQYLINKLDLQKEYISAVSYKMSLLYLRDSSVLQYKSEDIVKNMLVLLMEFPEDFRSNTSVLKFIEQRTTLSRSCIQRILLNLKNKNRVGIVNARLVDIRDLFVPN
ncbi:helix-turn-helix domain-containing protein [Serratia sp. D1N4]